MSYRIDCTVKDGPDLDRRIDRVGGWENGTAPNGSWCIPLDDAIALYDQGYRFHVVVNGYRVDVFPLRHPISGRRYLTTEADGYPPNNLLRLPDCY